MVTGLGYTYINGCHIVNLSDKMNHINEFNRFVQAHLTGDTETVKQIVDTVTRDTDTTIIKCLNCGEIIAFEKTRTLFMYAAGGVPAEVNYRIIKHIQDDPKHNIVIPILPTQNFPISHTIEKRLRYHCENGDSEGPVDFETWLPSYVEHWRNKAEDKKQ
jgi:hypothetical protein